MRRVVVESRWSMMRLSSFELLFLACGLVYLVLLPPFRAPDERWHFFRACLLAEGRGFPEPTEHGVRFRVPADVIDVAFGPWSEESNGPVDPTTLVHFVMQPRIGGSTREVTSPYFPTYMVVPYLPAAVAIAAAKSFGLHPLLWLYLARLFTFSFVAPMVVAAIRLTSMARPVFQAVALFPLSIQQLCTVTADSVVIGASSLIVALAIRWHTAGAGSFRLDTMLPLGVMLAWSKITYLPLLLLLLPAALCRSDRSARWRALPHFVCVIAMIACFAWLGQKWVYSYHRHPRQFGEMTASVSEQSMYLTRQPAAFAGAFLQTIANETGDWTKEVVRLGRLEPVAPATLGYFIWALFLFSTAVREPDEPPATPSLRFAALTAAITTMLLIGLSLYLWWTPVGHSQIVGIQGRYFLPLLPVFVVALTTRRFSVRLGPRLRFVILAVWIAIWWMTSVSVVRHFYAVSDRMLPTAGQAVLMAIAGLIIATTIRFYLRPRNDSVARKFCGDPTSPVISAHQACPSAR